jgi:hypothetical protein
MSFCFNMSESAINVGRANGSLTPITMIATINPTFNTISLKLIKILLCLIFLPRPFGGLDTFRHFCFKMTKLWFLVNYQNWSI